MASSLLLAPTAVSVFYSKSGDHAKAGIGERKYNIRLCSGESKGTIFLGYSRADLILGRSLLGGKCDTCAHRRRIRCRSQLAELAPATSAAYGALLLLGGLFAFTRSGSKGSLFGGLTGAALSAAAYYLLQSPETRAVGDALGFGSAFLFACVFGIRLAATRKAAPAGPLLGLSVFALVVYISAYLQDSV